MMPALDASAALCWPRAVHSPVSRPVSLLPCPRLCLLAGEGSLRVPLPAGHVPLHRGGRRRGGGQGGCALCSAVRAVGGTLFESASRTPVLCTAMPPSRHCCSHNLLPAAAAAGAAGAGGQEGAWPLPIRAAGGGGAQRQRLCGALLLVHPGGVCVRARVAALGHARRCAGMSLFAGGAGWKGRAQGAAPEAVCCGSPYWPTTLAAPVPSPFASCRSACPAAAAAATGTALTTRQWSPGTQPTSIRIASAGGLCPRASRT